MLLQFEPINSTIDPSFLFELARFKLEVQKLDSSRIDITGLLESSTVLKVGENDQALPSRLSVSRESFNTTLNQDNGTIKGWLQNYNSFTEFKNADKQHLLQCFGDEIMARIAADSEFQDLNYLVSFGVICFADLKKYQYYHWFMFPAISPSVPYELESTATAKDCAEFELDVLDSAYQEFAVSNSTSKLFFIIQSSQIYSVGEYAKLAKSFPDSIIFGFLDPSASSEHPGWPLRNYLYLIFTKFNLQKVRVLCHRPARKQSDSNRSLLLTISGNVQGPTSCVGWERNGSKLIPKKTDVRPMMDPLQLANTAVDLNLKLMKWRLAPDLDLGKIAQTKCLLLGAGTLGCYVARSLMAWGVRHISFVDNGTVSFSNPVRQPLFNFKDCLEGGSPKAAKAAEALQIIFPGVNAIGHNVSIPMPGHFTNDKTAADIIALEELIKSHDAIFLLTDSRESRWLPTVLGNFHNKIVITSALGFDSFLVMRHGGQLGCYFCNDVVAPTDSMTDRTLDQQCTVTRPGLSSIAAGTTVELLASILNHPLGYSLLKRLEAQTNSESFFGTVPHQIRGQLGTFSTLLLNGSRYDQCTACSPVIAKHYREQGIPFIIKGMQSPEYIEEVTGLTKLKQESENVEFEWSDDSSSS